MPPDRRGTVMNRMISDFFNKRDKWIRFLFYVFDFFISYLSIKLIPNQFLSVLFILGILVINVFNIYVLDKDRISLSKIENLFDPKFKKKFSGGNAMADRSVL